MWAEGTGCGGLDCQRRRGPSVSELEGAGACLLGCLRVPRLQRQTGSQGHQLSEHLAKGDPRPVRMCVQRQSCQPTTTCWGGASSAWHFSVAGSLPYPEVAPGLSGRPRELVARMAPAVTSSGPQTPVDPPSGRGLQGSEQKGSSLPVPSHMGSRDTCALGREGSFLLRQ